MHYAGLVVSDPCSLSLVGSVVAQRFAHTIQAQHAGRQHLLLFLHAPASFLHKGQFLGRQNFSLQIRLNLIQSHKHIVLPGQSHSWFIGCKGALQVVKVSVQYSRFHDFVLPDDLLHALSPQAMVFEQVQLVSENAKKGHIPAERGIHNAPGLVIGHF